MLRLYLDKRRMGEPEPMLLLIINRGDCDQFRPCHEACGLFASTFKRLVQSQVNVCCVGIRWIVQKKPEPDSHLSTATAQWRGLIPFALDMIP